MNQLPFVSALIVTRNEEQFIEQAILSLIHQTYPKERYEILLIDGESTDNTLKIIHQVMEQYSSTRPDIRLLSNSGHILTTGWNIGIREAKGEYVTRIDAHAEADREFIQKSVETILQIGDAACVGGRLHTKSLSEEDSLIAKLLSSRFGVGNSSFRTADKPGYADTAVYGLYRKSVFEEVGLFNEQYVRNQDIELHARIRNAGGRFYFNPEIQSTYYSRSTVKKMLQQALGNGKWNMVLLREHPGALSARHLVPLIFVVYIAGSIILGALFHVFWIQLAIVLCVYFAIGFASSMKLADKVTEKLIMPFLYFLLHFSYGIGYLTGIHA